MSKVVRISEDALDIALKYGSNLSEGIRAMEKLIQHSELSVREITRSIENIIESKVREVIREELEMIGRF